MEMRDRMLERREREDVGGVLDDSALNRLRERHVLGNGLSDQCGVLSPILVVAPVRHEDMALDTGVPEPVGEECDERRVVGEYRDEGAREDEVDEGHVVTDPPGVESVWLFHNGRRG